MSNQRYIWEPMPGLPMTEAGARALGKLFLQRVRLTGVEQGPWLVRYTDPSGEVKEVAADARD